MPEIRPTAPPPRSTLLRVLAEQLGQIVPGWRPVAREILAESSRIDLVGVTGADRALVVAVGGRDGDLALVARALAQREWLAPRLRDWLQLAPDLGLDPDARVEALALDADPGPEARAAAAAIAPEALRLARYRFVSNGAATGVVLELVETPATAARAPDPPAPEPRRSDPPTGDPAGDPAAPFRTGLSDADLGLSDEERSEFE